MGQTVDLGHQSVHMAEETAPPPAAAAAAAAASKQEVVVAADTKAKAPKQVPQAETPSPPPPTDDVVVETTSGDEIEKPPIAEDESVVAQSVSFKEESNRVADLQHPEKKALDELKLLIQQAFNNHEFTLPPKQEEEEKAAAAAAAAAAATTNTEEEKPTQVVVEEDKTPAVVVIHEDGAKTVEAIQETIVSSSSSAAEAKKDTSSSTTTDTAPPPPPPPPPVVETAAEEVFIWGIPLVGDEKSDTILLKFLRARDFKAKEAFTMIKNTLVWRKEFGIDTLVEQDLGTAEDLDKVVFMNGFDKEGHPVCYNVYGKFQNRDLYQKTFSDDEKSQKFLRWRIQFLEKSIQKQLDFSPGGVCTIVQVNDLNNSPGPLKKELRQATNQALAILQDNYPEFVAKQIFINVPWWYRAFNRMISPFLTQRTKSKFVFAGPSKSAETLFKYITPEQVPVEYGGLRKEGGGGEEEFSTSDAVTQVSIKAATKQTVDIPVSAESGGVVLVWEVRVIGWDVSYGVEFVPSGEDGYTIIVEKTRKISSTTDESVMSNSFKAGGGEAGKLVLIIDNSTSKKKKLLYRFKTKPYSSD